MKIGAGLVVNELNEYVCEPVLTSALNVAADVIQIAVGVLNAGLGPFGVVITIEKVLGQFCGFVTVCKIVYVVFGAKLTTLVLLVVEKLTGPFGIMV